MQDEKIDIAVGTSAKCRVWKNQKWSWAEIEEKLLTEHKTNETFKEFIGSPKDEQLKIKDVGGYVGGYLRNGRRKPENVVHRQILTLDIDEAHSHFWDDFQLQFGNAAVLHGTHKYTTVDPRYRLVMPLSRECAPDEHVAVSRFIAGMLGIDLFDNTTFQCERLMFWPSNSKDTEYFARSQGGEWLDVDAVLASYTDWTDSSSWPTSTSAVDKIKSDATKQEDPETKRGVVGAFCRTYSISEVIETFLSEEYISAGEERFTYVKGSAGAGLVTYEDKFAFSHHGTDPCSGKLSNAFDLVRVHRYSHLDPAGTTVAKSKSFLAMEELCKEDSKVRKTLATEKIANAKYDFAEPLDRPEVDEDDEDEEEVFDIDWAVDLEVNGKGEYLPSSKNISLILGRDPRLSKVFRENLFDDKKYVFSSLPWRTLKSPEPIKDVDYSGIRNYIESVYGIWSPLKIDDSLDLEFRKHSFHPIKDYLDGLEWDGESRIDNLLIDYFGADDNIYTKEAMRKMLVGAVARVYRPGVKFDLVLTLVGDAQGTGKSTFISKLGQGWFSDSFHTIKGKEAFEQLKGAWVMEMAELSGLRKVQVEAVKHFITKQEDTYRAAFGRTVETYKRRCVFFATTNQKDFLQDPTGNRRFMPVDVNEPMITKKILSPTELVGDQIDQVWAEARTLYEKKEPLFLSPEAESIARKEQQEHSQVDDRQGIVEDFLECLLPADWADKDLHDRRTFIHGGLSPAGTKARQYVCLAEVWCECLGKEKSDMSRYNTRELNDILKSLDDWEQVNSTKNFKIYGKQKFYSRKLY